MSHCETEKERSPTEKSLKASGMKAVNPPENDDANGLNLLSGAVKDKLIFLVFSLNIFYTGFLAGFIPQYFYLWHTPKAIILIGFFWYTYYKRCLHFFILQFCYFTHLLILIYLWVPLGDTIRGYLFIICFTFAMGPIMIAITLWSNSLVLHSTWKMACLFLHVSPAVTLWGIRWYSTEDQGFPLCPYQTQPGPDGCAHIGFQEIVLLPTIVYILHQLLHNLLVDVLLRNFIEKNNLANLYEYTRSELKATDIKRRVLEKFRPKYQYLIYNLAFIFYASGTILISYFCFHWKYYSVVLLTVMFSVAAYNGASFYIDVFSKRGYMYSKGDMKPKAPEPFSKKTL